MDLGFIKIAFSALIAYGISLLLRKFFLIGALDIVKVGMISLFFEIVYMSICWFVKLEEFQILMRRLLTFKMRNLNVMRRKGEELQISEIESVKRLFHSY